MVFYNAFLPDITPVERIGRISGYGWGLGYLGGLLVLVFVLIAFVRPDVPWFGVTKIDGQNIRVTNVVVAAWLVVFSIPFVFWVPEVKPPISQRKIYFLSSLSQLQITFRRILKFKEVCRFLISRFIFNNGINLG